jgi:hypothetical protein
VKDLKEYVETEVNKVVQEKMERTVKTENKVHAAV